MTSSSPHIPTASALGRTTPLIAWWMRRLRWSLGAVVVFVLLLELVYTTPFKWQHTVEAIVIASVAGSACVIAVPVLDVMLFQLRKRWASRLVMTLLLVVATVFGMWMSFVFCFAVGMSHFGEPPGG